LRVSLIANSMAPPAAFCGRYVSVGQRGTSAPLIVGAKGSRRTQTYMKKLHDFLAELSAFCERLEHALIKLACLILLIYILYQIVSSHL
jgi:hypothetical protein